MNDDDIFSQANQVAGERWHAAEQAENAEIEQRIKKRLDALLMQCITDPDLLVEAHLRRFLVTQFCGCWLDAGVFVFDVARSYDILTGEGEDPIRLYQCTCLRHHEEDGDGVNIITVLVRHIGPQSFELLKPLRIGVE